MSARERVARAAVWLLPQAERSEPVHTALDVSAGSITAFVREVGGLTLYGMRRRGADIAGTSVWRVLADGLDQGTVWVLVFELADLLAHLRTGRHGPLESWPAAGLLAAALALALVGLDRVAGIAGIGWIAVWVPILAQYRTTAGLGPLLVPALGFLVLIAAPRRRRPDGRRLGWLAVPLAVALTMGPGSPASVVFWVAVVFAVAGAAVLMLPTDPRLALAAALPMTYVGAQTLDRGDAGSILMTAMAPAVLALAVLVHRYANRSRLSLEQ